MWRLKPALPVSVIRHAMLSTDVHPKEKGCIKPRARQHCFKYNQRPKLNNIIIIDQFEYINDTL